MSRPADKSISRRKISEPLAKLPRQGAGSYVLHYLGTKGFKLAGWHANQFHTFLVVWDGTGQVGNLCQNGEKNKELLASDFYFLLQGALWPVTCHKMQSVHYDSVLMNSEITNDICSVSSRKILDDKIEWLLRGQTARCLHPLGEVLLTVNQMRASLAAREAKAERPIPTQRVRQQQSNNLKNNNSASTHVRIKRSDACRDTTSFVHLA